MGVKVLLKREGRYLLLRRNPKKYPNIGAKWDIVGGRIEAGNRLVDELSREVREETSLELDIDSLEMVAAQDILRVPDRHVVRLTYSGTAAGEVVIDEESQEFAWFEPQEIESMKENKLDIYFGELIEESKINL